MPWYVNEASFRDGGLPISDDLAASLGEQWFIDQNFYRADGVPNPHDIDLSTLIAESLPRDDWAAVPVLNAPYATPVTNIAKAKVAVPAARIDPYAGRTYNRDECEKEIMLNYSFKGTIVKGTIFLNEDGEGYRVERGSEVILLNKWGDPVDVIVQTPEEIKEEQEKMTKNFCTISGSSVTFDVGLKKPIEFNNLKVKATLTIDEFMRKAYKQYVNKYQSDGTNKYLLEQASDKVILGITLSTKILKPSPAVFPVKITDEILSLAIEEIRKALRHAESALADAQKNAQHCVTQGAYNQFTSHLLNVVYETARVENYIAALEVYLNLQSRKVDSINVATTASNCILFRNVIAPLLQLKDNGVKYNYFYLKFKDNKSDVARENKRSYNAVTELYERGKSHEIMQLSLIEPKKSEVKDVKLTLFKLYPTIKHDLKKLKRKSSSLKATYVYQLGTDTTSSIWHQYNEIKNKIMMLGYKEFEVSTMISRYIWGQPVTACQITNQYVPTCFLVSLTRADNTEVVVNWFHIYDIRGDGNNGVSARYRASIVNPKTRECTFKEVDLSAAPGYFYRYSVKHHSDNPLKYLTVRSMPRENIKVVSKHKGYQPAPFLGVELEVERKEGCREDITEPVLNLIGHDFVILKTDGSLRGHQPFEIVTIPATLDYHRMKWSAFLDDTETKSQLKSYSSGNCGMHVHISRDSFTGLHLAKFLRFINCSENHSFITKIAQRANNNYAVYEQNRTLAQHKGYLNRGTHGPSRNGVAGHYDAVNASNEHTIEVRIFRGNLGKVQFFKNLEFVHAVWAYTRIAGMNEIGYKDFLFWLFKNNEKNYSNLCKWLAASGFNVTNLVVKRDLSETEKVKVKDKAKAIKKIQAVVNTKYKFQYKKDEAESKPKLSHLGKVPVEEILRSA